MEVSAFLAAFCVILSLMLAQTAFHVENEQISDKPQQVHDHHLKYFRYSVPQKFNLENRGMDLMSLADKDVVPHKKYLIKSSSGQEINQVDEKQPENVMMQARKGKWREWVEGPSKSEYFTMDYHWVRRRRPIHNQQIPFVP